MKAPADTGSVSAALPGDSRHGTVGRAVPPVRPFRPFSPVPLSGKMAHHTESDAQQRRDTQGFHE